jgi:predicted Zn finger-like uncharacterized protein
MQIICPNCATFYQIADAAIGTNGRSVRCVRCQTVWHATPPAMAMAIQADSEERDIADESAAFRAVLGGEPLPPEPTQVPAAPDQTPAEPSLDDLVGSTAPTEAVDMTADAPAGPTDLALADIPIPVEDAPPLVPALQHGAASVSPIASLDDSGPPDIESVAARRARAKARGRRNRFRVPMSLAIVALITLCAALLGLRKDVVKHAPQLASFYSAIGLPVNLRGLAFTDLKIGNEIHDGVPVLVVEGMIVSMVSMPVDVPRLRFALRSATGAEVYSWTAQPSQAVLGAFETMPFRSRLASPPAEGHDIQVRFFTRRDAVAGVR